MERGGAPHDASRGSEGRGVERQSLCQRVLLRCLTDLHRRLIDPRCNYAAGLPLSIGQVRVTQAVRALRPRAALPV